MRSWPIGWGATRPIAAALTRRGEGTVDELLPLVYGDVTERQLPVARYSLWAHLRALGQEGRAVPADAASGAEDSIETRWVVRLTTGS